MTDKEKQNEEIIKTLKEEARDAKYQLADDKYKTEMTIMKYQNIIKKMSAKLESLGVKVKEFK